MSGAISERMLAQVGALGEAARASAPTAKSSTVTRPVAMANDHGQQHVKGCILAIQKKGATADTALRQLRDLDEIVTTRRL